MNVFPKKFGEEFLLQELKNLDSQITTIINQHELEEWLTTKETCRFLGISPRTLQNFRNKGDVPFSRLGGKILFKLSDLKQLLTNSKVVMTSS